MQVYPSSLSRIIYIKLYNFNLHHIVQIKSISFKHSIYTNLCKKPKDMGQTIGKEENKDIGPVLGKCYDKYFAEPNKKWNAAEFYHVVSEIVEEMNKMLGSTQFHVPKTSTLEHAYNKHHKGKERSLSKEEFQRILQEVILDSGVTGMGIKDIFLFIFGIPIVTTFIKQRAAPNAVPNDVFIPAVTSASVFLLAKLNKI